MQHRYRQALALMALLLTLPGCSSQGAAPRGTPQPPPAQTPAPVAAPAEPNQQPYAETFKSYHAVIERQWIFLNNTGDISPVERMEIWEAGGKYLMCHGNLDDKGQTHSNTCFGSDGDRAWSYNSRDMRISVGPAVDAVRLIGTAGARGLVRWDMAYPHKVVGTKSIAGREAREIEVSRPDGTKDSIYLDTETNLPLKVQHWRGQARQEVVTVAQIEVNKEIDPALLTYKVPAGATAADGGGRWVKTAQEAAAVAGFTPVLPTGEAPRRIAAWPDQVALDYDGGVIYQSPTAKHPFSVRYAYGIGKAQGGPLVVVGGEDVNVEHLSWTQGDLMIWVEGLVPAAVQRVARLLAPDLTLPDPAADLVGQAKERIAMTPAMKEAAVQEAAKAGGPGMEHQDPVIAAHTFLTERLGTAWTENSGLDNLPELKLVAHTGVEAIVEVAAGVQGGFQRLYVQRLSTAPPTTLPTAPWYVVGFDPR